ncbi:Flp family type IVb pilin [Lentibacillus salinarum]|uniref:Flp family type IVb pilin n=1 Tax=Lentibacillus salinarum TaxID=446820 RepID=A0ABW3ZXD5_9BACI
MKKFWQDESGLSTLEYIIGAGVMAALAIAVFTGLQGQIEGAGEDVGGAIETAGEQSSGAVDDVNAN